MDAFVDGNGLFAVSGHRDAAHLTYLGLHGLQHRGRAGVAIASTAGTGVRDVHGIGRVADAIGAAELAGLSGTSAVGTVWGGAPGAPADSGLVLGRTALGPVAAVVSGRFTNGERLRADLQAGGALFSGQSDAELLLHRVAQSRLKTVVNRFVDALFGITGAFGAVLMTEDRVVAVRDPAGFRPLVLGRLDDAWMVASEGTAIRFAGGTVTRDIAPGEMVVLESGEPLAVRPFRSDVAAPCIYEFVGLARADAEVFGEPVYPVRKRLGARLASEQPCPHVDIVVAVPGAEAQADGFAEASTLPVAPGLLREAFAPTHLEAAASEGHAVRRQADVHAVPSVVGGRRVCVVAAAAPRGLEVARAVRMVERAGAVEVHLRIASPLVRRGCRFGVASPTQEQLLDPASLDAPDIVEPLGARSVGFLSLDGLSRTIRGPRCDACFSGSFPIAPEETDDQLPLFGESTDG